MFWLSRLQGHGQNTWTTEFSGVIPGFDKASHGPL
jgi:hypothetical protein